MTKRQKESGGGGGGGGEDEGRVGENKRTASQRRENARPAECGCVRASAV